jgi:hypothetical protein
MAVQTQLMQRMAEAMEHHGNGGNRVAPQDEDLMRKIERFIRLKAPTFSYSDDTLEADNWLRVIETKLDLTICFNEECVAIVAHQLEGPAKAWWDNYTATHPNPAFITWLEFCKAFREQYLPGELLVQKAQEFRTMTQGAMRVEEYERHFMKMMRYAPRRHQHRPEEADLVPTRPSPWPLPGTESERAQVPLPPRQPRHRGRG